MKTNKGISLIVLVITIIVMIILAGAIILSLNNSGIINKANEAVEKTNEATVKQLAELKWAEAYLNPDIDTDKEYRDVVINGLEAEGIDTSKYVIVVTEVGVQIINGWIQEGLTVRRGNDVLTIGDDIAYDETAEGTVKVKKDVAWKILGANDKGELLIMSTTDIADLQLGDPAKTDFAKSAEDWRTAEKQLNDLCMSYKYGKSATGSRSIKIEDIDKITGFDKTKYGEGTINEYGAEVTFIYNETNKPDYIVSTETKDFSGILATHEQLRYYNGTEFVSVNPTEGKKDDIIVAFENDYYAYAVNMDTTSKAYTMLFKDTSYWLATANKVFFGQSCGYCISFVHNGRTYSSAVCYSNGTCAAPTAELRVRAVVSLAPDIQLTGNSTTGWSY